MKLEDLTDRQLTIRLNKYDRQEGHQSIYVPGDCQHCVDGEMYEQEWKRRNKQ